jgi:hypothetical protein
MRLEMITQQELHELFEYRDGKLFNKVRRGNRSACGQEAKSLGARGYLRVSIDKKNYRLHRLVFLMHHGYMPEYIDHINCDKLDNRIENLRQATNAQNQHNTKKLPNNTSGTKGVMWVKSLKKWQGQVKLNKKIFYAGTFYDIESAKLAVAELRKKLHGEFANYG